MSHRKIASDPLGMTSAITRRDFINGVAAGGGAALLGACSDGDTASDPLSPSGSPWTGFGGVGDYRWSNGNTQAVMEAAHRFRDGAYPDASTVPVDETVDLVIVGGGFSGMTAAYEFSRRAGPGRTCLLLENHPIVGGEAKQNEFLVEGRRLTAPQGSNGALLLKDGYVKGSYGGELYDVYTDYYRELGIPTHAELEPVAGGAERYNLTDYHFSPMAPASEAGYGTAYHFPGRGWVRDPSKNGFADTPWSPAAQRDMDDFVHNRRDVLGKMGGAEAWLDSITYYDLLDRLGYGAEVRRYIDPYIAVANFGVCGNAISGLAAHRLGLPGTALPGVDHGDASHIGVVSFPGGNAAILRMMLARMIPGAIAGDGRLAALASGPIDFAKLDRAGAPLRIRGGATVTQVVHEGRPADAEHVLVTYARDGKLRKIRARSVVMASGGWVNRTIVGDLPNSHRQAYRAFHYGPVMIANVALRNWRFFDRLGFTAARWFEGLGWQVSVRRNVALGPTRALTPDDPTVLTFYIPFLDASLPASAQGPAARTRLLATSYGDFEWQLREQMTEMFGAAGFDARRDIAGIILNRWGHAFVAPQPGFFLGHDGLPPPAEVLRRPHGRIVFAHSELQGLMSMACAMMEGHRGARQAMAML